MSLCTRAMGCCLCSHPLNCRYKLLNPAPEYVSVHAEVQRRFDLAVRAAAVLAANPAISLPELMVAILHQGTNRAGSPAVYSPNDVQPELGFLLGQLNFIAKVGY